MGSGYKSFTSGIVLTASDVMNYLQEQTVMYFASTTARDLVLPAGGAAAERGMVCYIASNDANEGFYVYNGTNWRKGASHNAPYGSYGAATATSTSTTSIGTTAISAGTNTLFSTGTLSITANRLYEVSWTVTTLATGAALQTVTFELWNATTKVVGLGTNSISGTAYYTTSGTAVVSGTATSTPVWSLKASTGGGGGTYALAGNVSPHYLIVKDIGPNGAPA